MHISEIFTTFAVDLVKRYQSIHILLTALAIISRSKKKAYETDFSEIGIKHQQEDYTLFQLPVIHAIGVNSWVIGQVSS